MYSFRKLVKDQTNNNLFRRGTFFIVVNAFLLYVLFFLIKNFGHLASIVTNGLNTLSDVCTPLIIGLVIAYLISPLADLIDRRLMHKVLRLPSDSAKADRRSNLYHFISVILALLIVLAAFLALIYGFLFLIISQIPFEQFPRSVSELTAIIADYESAVQRWISTNLPDSPLTGKFDNLGKSLMSWVSQNFSASGVIKAFSSFGGGVINTVIGIIISVYLMKDKKLFIRLWNRFLLLFIAKKKASSLNATLNEINGVLSSFVRGALLDSIIIAIMSSIGLSILGVKGAVFIGIFAGIANVIPYFGPIIGMIPAFIMGFASDGLIHGIIAVCILLLIQQIDSNFIYPKVVGKSTGLHPLAVLLGITVFGYFWGIIGMLLAVPTCGVLQIFIRKWIGWRKTRIEQLANREEEHATKKEEQELN